MQLLNILNYTYQTLSAHKSRVFLTMLGIIIGVASVIAIMSVGASAQKLLVSQVESLGSNLIGILPGPAEEGGPPSALFGIVTTTLKYDDALAIKELPHVLGVASYTKGRGTMSYGNEVYDFDYTGITPDYLAVENTSLDYGRFIRQEDVDSLARVAVLGSKVKKDLFGDDNPLDKQIKINQTLFRVLGVMEERGTAAMFNQDEQVFIPLKTAQKIMLGVDYLSYIRLKVEGAENIAPTIVKIKELLRHRHNIKDPSKDDFTVRSTAQALDILGTITQALKLFLAAVAAISLIVGGIGIMNIMFVTVTERTKEIGLRKAVGAKRFDILIQFLIESAILTLIGGLLGILAGAIIAFAVYWGVNYYGYDWKFIITPSSVLISTLMAISIGLIFGLWPANRASKLEPAEALRK